MEGKGRIFFRIETKMPAKIFVDGKFYKDVFINELSTTGLSFCAEKNCGIPNYFELQLRLPRSFRLLRVKMEVMNKQDSKGADRIGCRFISSSDEDEDAIIGYVLRFMDIATPSRLLGIAAFLLAIDALIRVFAYIAALYYGGTPFVRNSQVGPAPYSYGIVLLLYATACFTALIFCEKTGKKFFLASILFTALAVIFIAARNIMCLKLRLWQYRDLLINGFLAWQYALLVYSAFAVGFALKAYKRTNLVTDSLSKHALR